MTKQNTRVDIADLSQSFEYLATNDFWRRSMKTNNSLIAILLFLLVSGCGGSGSTATKTVPVTSDTTSGDTAKGTEIQDSINSLPPELRDPPPPAVPPVTTPPVTTPPVTTPPVTTPPVTTPPVTTPPVTTPPVTTPPSASTLIFQNGFEGNTAVTPRANSSQHFDLKGSDENDKPSTWNSTEMRRIYGAGQFYCQTGTPAQRVPEIVADPDSDPKRSKNKVLAIKITESHITMPDTGERKSRCQWEINNTAPRPAEGYVRQWYSKMDQYWSPNFSVLENAKINNKDTDNIGWFITQEFWNGSPNTKGEIVEPITRTAAGIYKKNGKLHFSVSGRKPLNVYPPTWEVKSDFFDIPLGKWFTLETYVKEGDEKTGRFYMAVIVDGKKTVLVEKTGITTTTGPGFVPDGMTSFTLMKVYTEGKVLDWFKAANKPLIVYYDNVKVCSNTTPETANNACN
jgi:hypothetical protein